MSPKVKAGPVVREGTIMRVVSEGERVFSEVWNGSAWVRGGFVSDILKGRPVSAEELAASGIDPAGSASWPDPD